MVGQVESVHVRSCAAVTVAALLLAWTLVDTDLLFVSAAKQYFVFWGFVFFCIYLWLFIVMSRVAQDIYPPPPSPRAYHFTHRVK